MPMSAEHKAALKQGRQEARAIRSYLEALGDRRPGRPITKESLEAKIGRLEEKIRAEENPLKAVQHRQDRIDAERQLAEMANPVDMEALEAGFVRAAPSYSARKGITYSAWREAGVPAATLRKAGIKRGG